MANPKRSVPPTSHGIWSSSGQPSSRPLAAALPRGDTRPACTADTEEGTYPSVASAPRQSARATQPESRRAAARPAHSRSWEPRRAGTEPAEVPPPKTPDHPPPKDGHSADSLPGGGNHGGTHSPQPQGSPEVPPHTPLTPPRAQPGRQRWGPTTPGEEHDASTDRQPPHRRHQGHRNSGHRPPNSAQHPQTATTWRAVPMPIAKRSATVPGQPAAGDRTHSETGTSNLDRDAGELEDHNPPG